MNIYVLGPTALMLIASHRHKASLLQQGMWAIFWCSRRALPRDRGLEVA